MIKIAGVAMALMGIAIYFLFNAYTHQVELRVAFEVAAKAEKLAREYQEKTASMSQTHANEMFTKDNAITRLTSEKEREINALRSIYEKELREKPFDTGNDFERRIAHVMCLIQSGSHSGARETCDIQARQSYSPDIAITVTVTQKTTDDWRIFCEEGKRDYCDYAIMGFTKDGALTLLNWLNQVDEYQVKLNHYKQGQDKVIDDLVDMTGND